MSVAIIQGAGGGIGQALASHILRNTGLKVYALTHGKAATLQDKLGESGGGDRLSVLDGVDVTNEETLHRAAEEVKKREGKGSLRLIACLAGILRPEKSLSGIKYDDSLETFKINTIGHLITYKHFVPLLPTGKEFKEHQESWKGDDPAKGLVSKDNAVCWSMSARVGSIEGNEKGGWYSYRASKAALNQIIRSLDHELINKSSSAVAVGYHPGTTITALSKAVLGQNIKPDPKNGRFEVDEALKHLVDVMGKVRRSDEWGGRCFDWKGERVPWSSLELIPEMIIPMPTPTQALTTALHVVHADPLQTAAVLLRGLDLGPVGDIGEDIAGVGEKAVGGVEKAADSADKVGDTLDKVNEATKKLEEAKKQFDHYYALYQKYKQYIYLALIVFGIILAMCFLNCAIQWCRNCCFCVKCGYKCTQYGCKGLGWCCVSTKLCVCGLEQAIEDAHKRGKEYDGMDQTGWRRYIKGGEKVPENLKEAAHQKWYGDTRGWFGRNIARLWGGNTSRTVRDFAAAGKGVWLRWDAEGRLEKYKGKSKKWIKIGKKFQRRVEAKLAERGWVEGPRPEDVVELSEPPPPNYQEALQVHAPQESGIAYPDGKEYSLGPQPDFRHDDPVLPRR